MKKRLSLVICPLAAYVASACPVWAWGDMGHRVIARIAASRLSPQALARIATILDVESDPAAVSDAMADASTWADHVGRPRFPATAEWHFIDMSLRDGENDAPPPFADSNAAPAKIIQLARALQAGAPDVVDAPNSNLLFLIHLVGDIHQPLHTATNQDRGGNCLQVRFAQSDGRISQLMKFHHAWDTGLVEDNLGTGDRPIALHLVRDFENLSEKGQRSILLEDPAAAPWDHAVRSWTMESHKIALNPVYAELNPPAPVLSLKIVNSSCSNAASFTRTQRMLDTPYVRRAASVIDQQLLAAGIRLGALLNAIYK